MKKLMMMLSVIALATSAFCGCGGADSAPESSIQSPASIQEKSETTPAQIIASDFPTYADVTALAADSVLVVLGQYGEGAPTIVNTAKDAENSQAESQETYAESHVFTFHVQEVLKGDCADDEISVGLSYGIRPAGFSELAVKDTYLEPTTEDSKILFLLYSDSDGFYYPTSQPYQLRLTQSADSTDGSTAFVLDTAVSGLDESFAIEADSMAKLRELIG